MNKNKIWKVFNHLDRFIDTDRWRTNILNCKLRKNITNRLEEDCWIKFKDSYRIDYDI